MASVHSVTTVAPAHHVNADVLQTVSETWLHGEELLKEKFLRIGSQSGVRGRDFIIPYHEILSLKGLQYRAELFEKYGTEMLFQAIDQAVHSSPFDPEEIGMLIFTSCSIPVIPSIDAAALLRSSLPNTTNRIPMYQHGCAGGVVALSHGARFASLGKPVVIASVELCSLVFQPGNRSGAHLVGAAIFADGAAATVISPASVQNKIVASQSTLLPETRHLMGYDIFDDGFHLRLDRALPAALVKEAPAIVQGFLSEHGKDASEIKHWLFHPGGIKILEFLRDTFSLDMEQCHWSYDILRDHGNLSSATILYVLGAFLKDAVLAPGENALVMGIGPGLTVELVLIEG